MKHTSGWLLAAAILGSGGPAGAAPARGGPAWCGTGRDAVRDALWAHREAGTRRGVRASAVASGVSRSGQIAVVEDHGDLALLRNNLDLRNLGLRFSPTGGGFSVTRVDTPLVSSGGTPLPLGDDDSRTVDLPFAFPYFGASYTSVFVNSDGNLTFTEGDSASTSRNLGRLVAGPPRLAPLLADLDPSAGGSVTVLSAPDRFAVTWSAVPQWGKSDRNSLQVAFSPDGRVEFAYADVSASLEEGVAGLGPGREQGGVTAVDFSQAAGVVGGSTLAESFRDADALDTLALARRFYSAFPDEYQQLIVYSTRRLTARNTFAYEQTVRNEVQGLGLDRFDASADYGSGGRLESFVFMDDLEKHLEPFDSPFLGADSTLSVLAHEVGHRFLTRAVFRDGTRDSEELLGRDEVHWSFFMDSDGSHLEGNDIEDQGGGRFRTTAASTRYGPLDQYLMGLRPIDEVPPFFFVRDPNGNTSGVGSGRDPEVGVTFTGTRRDVTAADLVSAMGPREPPFGEAPRDIRQAFILVSVGGPPTRAQLDKLERIRTAWPAFYSRSTDGRGAADPRLQ